MGGWGKCPAFVVLSRSLSYVCIKELIGMAILDLFLLMTNNWIIEPPAMRFARANDLFAALLG